MKRSDTREVILNAINHFCREGQINLDSCYQREQLAIYIWERLMKRNCDTSYTTNDQQMLLFSNVDPGENK